MNLKLNGTAGRAAVEYSLTQTSEGAHLQERSGGGDWQTMTTTQAAHHMAAGTVLGEWLRAQHVDANATMLLGPGPALLPMKSE